MSSLQSDVDLFEHEIEMGLRYSLVDRVYRQLLSLWVQ